MSIILEREKGKEIKNSSLTLSKVASDAKKSNPNAINATIGMFFDEDNVFKSFPTVQSTINNLNAFDAFSYLETTGGIEYQDAVKEWVFDKNLEFLEKKNFINVCATPGGSGAISLSMSNYLNENDYCLIPSKRWEPYYQMCVENHINNIDYNLYNEKGLFDLDDIKLKADNVLSKSDRLYIILNDPCHNPTGFSMEEEDYDNLIAYLKTIDSNKKVVLLIDIAYLDYSANAGDDVRRFYNKFDNLPSNIMIHFAFSASKTFRLYGLRVGALVCLTSSKEESDLFIKASEYTSRTTWSNVSHLGVEVVKRLVNDETFESEITNSQKILEARSNLFLENAKKYNLNYSAYKNGFFVCVYSDKCNLHEELMKKYIYTTPVIGGVRIALSCITLNDIEKICFEISNIINKE